MRRKARRVILQALYESDVAGHPVEECLGHVLEDTDLDQENVAFVTRMSKEVASAQRALDETIQRFAPSWPVAQLPSLDRNILRLAIHELTSAKETPPKVAINEAVVLAKLFGSEGSPRFVNGVLGSVMTALEEQKGEANPFPRQEVDGADSPTTRPKPRGRAPRGRTR
ncbi:MAG: transcription antitermination factor NusB [Chloroflexi bacterium]|nr:transcription antitermination factor NusB [Chloroflexota bacterium]